MSRSDLDLLVEALSRFGEENLAARGPESEGFDQKAWSVLGDLGFTGLSIDEQFGGSGATLVEAITACEVIARYGVEVPLGDHSVVAGWLCEQAGWPMTSGPMSGVVADPERLLVLPQNETVALEGEVSQAPWAQCADRLIVVAPHQGRFAICSVDPKSCSIVPRLNMAGEPRDTVVFDGTSQYECRWLDSPVGEQVALRGALVRAAQTSGALYRVVELTAIHVTQRSQFGKPLGSFQAVRHRMAEMAGETAAARVAVSAAAQRSLNGIDPLAVMCAKLQSCRAATLVSKHAHQLLGAIGTTKEHELGRHTRRLWSWRDDYGREDHWAQELGRQLSELGPQALWPAITGE